MQKAPLFKILRNWLAAALVIVGVAVALQLFLARRTREKYSPSADIEAATKIVQRIHQVQQKCYGETGGFVDFETLGTLDCGKVFGAISKRSDGYEMKIVLDGQGYSIQLVPGMPSRLLSFYSDQSGVIRWGTREEPANKSSPAIR